jgi:uncharacterized membrane protein YgdD (TMEM256/DUF423 family)
MRKIFLRIGSLLALAAVALGAFGSHGLEGVLEAEQLETYEIGVRYQFYHAFAILLVGALSYFGRKKFMTYAGWLFIAGVVCFSGSLYLLSLQEIFEVPAHILGPVTPVGGTFFILGWFLLFLSTFQNHERK